MNFIALSSLKNRRVSATTDARNQLKEFTDFLTSTTGNTFEISDVVTKIILEDSFGKDIKPKEEKKPEPIALKLPEAAWKVFDEIIKKTGLDQAELVELIARKACSDRSFTNWKKKPQSKSKKGDTKEQKK